MILLIHLYELLFTITLKNLDSASSCLVCACMDGWFEVFCKENFSARCDYIQGIESLAQGKEEGRENHLPISATWIENTFPSFHPVIIVFKSTRPAKIYLYLLHACCGRNHLVGVLRLLTTGCSPISQQLITSDVISHANWGGVFRKLPGRLQVSSPVTDAGSPCVDLDRCVDSDGSGFLMHTVIAH